MLIKPTFNNSLSKIEVDKKSMKNRALEMLSQVEEDKEGMCCPVIDQILKRAINTARYARSDKDATSAGKWLWEIAFGRSPVAVEESEQELTPVVFRLNPKDKALLEDMSKRDDMPLDEDETERTVISIDGEPDMEF